MRTELNHKNMWDSRKNHGSYVWSRSFSGVNNNNNRNAWNVNNSSGDINNNNVNNEYGVAPAFYILYVSRNMQWDKKGVAIPFPDIREENQSEEGCVI